MKVSWFLPGAANAFSCLARITLRTAATSLIFSASGRLLAFGGEDGIVHICQSHSLMTLYRLPTNGTILHMAWSYTDDRFAVASDDGVVRVFTLGRVSPDQLIRSHASSLAWIGDGQLAIVSPQCLLLVDVKAKHRVEASTLFGLPEDILAIGLAPSLTKAAIATKSGYLVVRSLLSPNDEGFYARSGLLHCLTWSPDSYLIATGTTDNTILVWDVAQLRVKQVLEGHAATVVGVQFSASGITLSSRSDDNRLRLWRSSDWSPVLELRNIPASNSTPVRMGFHPYSGTALVAAEHALAIWDCDEDAITSLVGGHDVVKTATAKIVLLGDSGVGKTGLGWRLAYGTFKAHTSTHGQQFWIINSLSTTRRDGVECRAIMWDLAGQPDYRLIHALFLDDADLALVLFDATKRHEPLASVEYWLGAVGSRCPVILVGSRIDVGTLTFSLGDLRWYCTERGVSGGVTLTSALEGTGLQELLTNIRRQLDWEAISATTTNITLRRIKEHILQMKGNENVTAPMQIVESLQLHARLRQRYPTWTVDATDIETAVTNLAKYGYIRALRDRDGRRWVLLNPEIVNNLASSIILRARAHPKGLGAIDESTLLTLGYEFAELQFLSAEQKALLVENVLAILLSRTLCFREALGEMTLLVFPDLINQSPSLPAVPMHVTEDVSYVVTGEIEHAFSSLVVLLGYTNAFRRALHWKDRAQYELDNATICGFRRVTGDEGRAEFIHYYSTTADSSDRRLFQGLFEKFLLKKRVEVRRYPPLDCDECGYRQLQDLSLGEQTKARESYFAAVVVIVCVYQPQRM